MKECYTRADVQYSKYINEQDLNFADMYIEEALKTIPKNSFLVMPWEDVPKSIRYVFPFNGGDEDWLILCHQKPEHIPRWLYNIDSCCEPDEYYMGKYYAYVGSHA